jgi:methyl-accepting chemotaxis protein
MKRQWALRKKLVGGFGVIMLCMGVGAVFSLVEIRGLTGLVQRAAAIHELTETGTLASDLIGIEHAMILYSIFDDKASVQQNKDRLRETSRTFAAALDRAAAIGGGVDVQPLRAQYAAWTTMHNEIVGYLENQQVDLAEKRVADPAFTSVVSRMRELANKLSENEAKRMRQEAGSSITVSLIGFSGLAVLCITAGFFILLNIARVSSRLGTLTDSLAGSSDQVQALAAGASQASEQMARLSSEQAASLGDTTSSAEQVTTMTGRNLENAESAAAVMKEVDENVRAGNRTLESMLVSMTEINSSSERIRKIIRVIEEIAFQTNILALNAAVEAARAGEAGMGFAVVADEVRNLAQRSSQAARDTAAMIEESISRSNDGGQKLSQLTEMIAAITASAAKVKTLVDSVSVGSHEQARGIEQISCSVRQMDQMTRNTSTSAQESAAASERLAEQAAVLNRVVTEVRGLVYGSN